MIYIFVSRADVVAERDHVKELALAAQRNAQSVTAAKDMTVQDLTRGILNYKYLGLDFQKAEPDRLRCVISNWTICFLPRFSFVLPSKIVLFSNVCSFTFTQLDPNHPDHEYSFCLAATEDDLYSVVDCQPAQSQAVLDDLIVPLNETNDMMAFVRSMRHMFLQHIPSK
jgi:Chromosome segregation protein Spc25